MKLFTFAALLVLGNSSGQCSAIMSQDDSWIAEEHDDACRELALAAQPDKVARPKASRSRGAAGNAPEEVTCFLCADDLEQVDSKTVFTTWRGFKLHMRCAAACKCHWRLLTEAEKAEDQKFLAESPQEWKDVVKPLISSGKRDIGTVKNHRQNLQHLTKFTESVETNRKLLLTRTRFKSYMQQWEQYNSDSASESFDRRNNATDSDHEDSDGNTRVAVRGNTEIAHKKGTRSEGTGSRRRTSPRESRSSRAESSGARRRGRSRSRSQHRGGGRAKSSPAGKQQARTAVPTPSPQSVRSQGRPSSASAPSAGRDSAGKRLRLVRKSSNARGFAQLNRSSRHIDASDEDVVLTEPNACVDYLVKVKEFKTKIEKVTKQAALKTWPATKLQKDSQALDEEARKRLAKQGNYIETIKNIGDKVKTLNDMSNELSDLDANQTDLFEQRLKKVFDELEKEDIQANKYVEACGFLAEQASKSQRKQKLADGYQKRKWANKLRTASWGEGLASVVGILLRENDPSPVVGLESEITWDQPMVFDSEQQGFGPTIYGAMSEYQLKCEVQIEGKKDALLKHLGNNDKKTGAMAVLPQGSDNVKLSERGIKLPGGGHELHDQPGSAAWLVVQARRAWRFGPAQIPMPGLGSFIQLAPGSTPVTLLLVPLQHVAAFGLIDFKDLPKFLETSGGQKLAKESCGHFTLEKPTQIGWVPYGTLVVPIANMWAEDDKQEDHGSLWWLTIFNKALAKQVGDQAWKAIHSWNAEHMQKMSGQELWKHRLEACNKLHEERSKD